MTTIKTFIAALKPQGIAFTNADGVITVSASNGGNVDLRSLTTLPDNVTFSNGGNVYLRSLTSETQRYRGKQIRLRNIDGYTMLIVSTRTKGNISISRAQYFRGDKAPVQRCYIASQGEHNAHGETANEALLDLRFKIAQVDYDPSELVEAIKARGSIKWVEFRLLTGACAEGLREGLRGLGYAPDLDEMPLADAMRVVRGHFGDARMAALFGEAA